MIERGIGSAKEKQSSLVRRDTKKILNIELHDLCVFKSYLEKDRENWEIGGELASKYEAVCTQIEEMRELIAFFSGSEETISKSAAVSGVRKLIKDHMKQTEKVYGRLDTLIIHMDKDIDSYIKESKQMYTRLNDLRRDIDLLRRLELEVMEVETK